MHAGGILSAFVSGPTHRCLTHINFVIQLKLMESPSTPLILVVIGASIGLFGVALLRMVDIFKKTKQNVTSFRAYSGSNACRPQLIHPIFMSIVFEHYKQLKKLESSVVRTINHN
jgi:H+/Cl- antiporter ClcA